MEEVQGPQAPFGYSSDLALLEDSLCDYICQGTTFQKLHDDPQFLLHQEAVYIVDNVGMAEFPHDLNFRDDELFLWLVLQVHFLDGNSIARAFFHGHADRSRGTAKGNNSGSWDKLSFDGHCCHTVHLVHWVRINNLYALIFPFSSIYENSLLQRFSAIVSDRPSCLLVSSCYYQWLKCQFWNMKKIEVLPPFLNSYWPQTVAWYRHQQKNWKNISPTATCMCVYTMYPWCQKLSWTGLTNLSKFSYCFVTNFLKTLQINLP